MGRTRGGRGRSGRDGRGERGRGRLSEARVNNPYTKRKQEEREEMTNNQKTREINNIEDNIMEEVDDCPLKTIGSKEWNNVALIEIEVFKLRKSMTGITDKEERVTVCCKCNNN